MSRISYPLEPVERIAALPEVSGFGARTTTASTVRFAQARSGARNGWLFAVGARLPHSTRTKLFLALLM